MSARVILQRNNRSSWLRLRSQGLGGTDVAAVLGFDKWRTPLDVWLDKTGRGDRTLSSYPMRRGTFMERFLLDEYARRNAPAILDKPPALLAHPDLPILRASLDGLAHHPDRTVILDAKAPTWRGRADWWDDEKACPDSYAIQMLVYLAVTGLDEAVLVADVAGEYREVRVDRNPDWEAAALPLLDRWWAEHVVADQPPPVDWQRDSIPALNRTWATEPGTAVEASDAVAGAVEACRVMSDKAATFKRLTDALRVQIREGMGTAQVLTIGGEKAASLDSRGILRVTKQKGEEQ